MTGSAARPIFVFDGDCGFCRRWVERWRAQTGGRVDFQPYQQASSRLPSVPREDVPTASYLVEPNRTTSAARAVFGLLAYAPSGGLALRLYERFPPFAWASEASYRLVARHRVLAARATTLLWGDDVGPHRFFGARWLFLRALALVYLNAFASLGVQVAGLLGSRGILPAAQLLEGARRAVGPRAFWLLPSLTWLLGASDAALKGLCWAGAAAATLAVLDVAPGPSLLACWACYLSLVNVGRDFLSFQWDVLLLEAGLLAVFLAPWRLRPRLREAQPSAAFLWLLRWLLFRLMLESGLVKLLSGDRTWRDMTALYFHYQTQPLPTWIGWHAHQLPAWFQRSSVVFMFFIELAVPWLILLPRRPRAFAFGAFVFLQLLIYLTGNYGFFNLLAFALCLPLLDDATLRRFLPGRWKSLLDFDPPRPRRDWRAWAAWPIGSFIALSSALQFARFVPVRLPGETAGARLLEAADGFHICSSYGLFAVMTTTRLEIAVEGSDDGRQWKEYRFKWKPGDPARAPAFVEPHMPRLDWQMWFAALGPYQDSPWYFGLLARLLEGSPEVLGLLANNPFPDHPPRYLRSLGYEYRFTTRAERAATGEWWHRELKGLYAPVVGVTSSVSGLEMFELLTTSNNSRPDINRL